MDLGTGTVRFDPNVEIAHHHLVCRSCGKVRDVDVDTRMLTVPRGEDQGYDLGSTEVVFRGLCPDCRTAVGATRKGTKRPEDPQETRRSTRERKRATWQH
jgi:Fe2+ or Zn2+ uptake regulation protein